MAPIPGRPPWRPGRGSGFTLVELLIALAMVGLITLLLFSALRIGSRAWDAVELVAERNGALRLARDFLQGALRQARATTVVFEGTPVSVFSGDAERLEFVTPLAGQLGVPGLYILRLTLEDSGGGIDLILTRWLIHPEVLEGGDENPAWEPLREPPGSPSVTGSTDLDRVAGAYGRTLLLESLDDFAIEYFGTPEGEDEPLWLEHWLEQDGLPALVRIRMRALGQSAPDLIVALPAQPS